MSFGYFGNTPSDSVLFLQLMVPSRLEELTMREGVRSLVKQDLSVLMNVLVNGHARLHTLLTFVHVQGKVQRYEL